ncbi:MAG: ribosome-associated translation inhibitor RaiA [Minisyncoccia bacterium]|jgi:putative sigma-54 modulation protein
MKIILHAKNLELTPAIRDYVDEKIGSIAKFLSSPSHSNLECEGKPNKDLIEARVEVSRPSRHHHEGDVFYAEVNLKMGKNLMRATYEHNDPHVAIDRVRDEIERQIKKFKEKRSEKERRS